MGDEYVSVEHLFLSILKYPSRTMKQLLNRFGITRDGFLKALSTVSGPKDFEIGKFINCCGALIRHD